MPLKTQNTILSIQALRAIAAAMVVVFHSFNYLHARNLIPEIPGIIKTGRAGVDIFFVISGFIMVWISGNKFGKPGAQKDFIIKRIIRVAPIYWAYTLLMAALMLTLPHLVSQGKTVSITHLAASLLFIPWENNIGYVKPVLGVGWTLNYEMYFYVLFGALLFLREKYFLPLLTALLLLGIGVRYLTESQPAALDVITSPLILEFLAGCTIAIFYKRNPRIPSAILVIMLIGGVCALLTTGLIEIKGVPRIFKWGIPCSLIVASAVLLEKNQALQPFRILTTLGNSSYSLYLSHIFTISVVGKAWMTFVGPLNGAFIIAASVISIIGGHIAYLLFEKPVTKRLNEIYRNNSARNSSKEFPSSG